MGFTLIPPTTYMGIVLCMAVWVIAQHQLPYLNLGPSVPALIYRTMETMEKPQFSNTMNFATFCKKHGINGLNFKSYTRKTGPAAGTKGLWASFTLGDTEIRLAVASALVPKHKELKASMLEVSDVTWPGGDTSVLVHGVGGDAHYVDGFE